MRPAATPRQRDQQRIHAMRRRLRMTDDAYRDLIADLFDGRRSSTDLTDAERARFVHHLQRLVDALPGHPGIKRVPLSPKAGKMFSLWQQLADAGLVENRRMPALDAWITDREWLGQRVDNKRWLSNAQEDQVIEALKLWLKRGSANAVRETAHGA